MKRIFFIAGEESGDTHGANLITALKAQAPSIQCEGLGGRQMAGAGMKLHYDLAGDAIMGFTEVLKHYPAIRRLFLDTLEAIRQNPPDLLVLIDYPGFNLRFAKAAHPLGIPIVYYISPQVWAWKKKRIHTIARYVRKMLVIFPFEEALYRDIGLDCAYVGHPLLDHVAAFQARQSLEGNPVIGLLPGSRQQEIRRLIQPMIAVAQEIRNTWPEARFYCPCVNAARADQIRGLVGDFPLEIVPQGMYDVLANARFCLVASGTATLETALFGVPMVILYRISSLSFLLARLLVHIDYIGIVNILAGRGIVPEFIQHRATPEHITPAALELIAEGPARKTMLEAMAAVREGLGAGGASRQAAKEVLALLPGGHPNDKA